jgi:hypothetical protein
MAATPRRIVSSRSTVFWKFVFPALWIVGFGAGAIVSALASAPGDASRWLPLCIWLLGSAFLVWFSVRLCWVAISDGCLVVSTYFRETSVPLSAVSGVTQSYLSRPQTLTLRIDCDTALGRRFLFIAPGWPRIFSRHPLAIELERMSALSQSDGDANHLTNRSS